MSLGTIELGTWDNSNWIHDEQAVNYTKGKVKWLIIEEDENFYFCVSDKILFIHCWNDNLNKGNSYSKSDIRHFLNNDFYNRCFGEEEKKKIVSHKISDVDTIIKDNVFLLSTSEVAKLSRNELYRIYWWWSRTKHSDTDNRVWQIHYNTGDSVNHYQVTAVDGVRPAIVVRKTDIEVMKND